MHVERRAPLVALSALGMALLLLVAFLGAGWSEEAVRVVIRWTARVGIVLFAAAFSAGPLRSLWRVESTRWMVTNRRGLGLSFALVHTTHLAALVVLGLEFPDPFVDGLDVVTLVGGGLAYVFMGGMAATSNDAAVRWLGPQRWRRLHTVGGWYILIIFAQTYGPRALLGAPHDLALTALTLAVPALRFARWRRRRRRRRAGGSVGVEREYGRVGGRASV